MPSPRAGGARAYRNTNTIDADSAEPIVTLNTRQRRAYATDTTRTPWHSPSAAFKSSATAGTDAGFAYRSLYLDGVRDLGVEAAALPFVARPVIGDAVLAQAIREVFEMPPHELLGGDELMQTIAQRLLHLACSSACSRPAASKQRAISDAVLHRAREFLDANALRVVTSRELETTCGETRFALGSAFKRRFGTSLYRYLLMRRLDYVRARLSNARSPAAPSLASLALEAAFADQAHLTRMFRRAYGFTPAAYARLIAPR